MLKNHIVTAIRNSLRRVGFSLINIVGLSVGLASGIYVIHYAGEEYSYDRFHRDAANIYRVSSSRLKDGVETAQFAATYAGLAPALKAEFPEVELTARMFHRWRGGVVSRGDIMFREKGVFHADSGFFDVFSFPIKTGDARRLSSPGFALIEEEMAFKYFGSENPVGKTIRFGSSEGVEEYEVGGVFQCPQASSLKINFLFSYHNLDRTFGTDHLHNWLWVDFHTFIRVKDPSDAVAIEARFPDLLKKYRADRASLSKLSLQPLTEIHLGPARNFEIFTTGDESVVRILLVLGIIIVIIVSLNFVNLTTAQAMTRAKEVGIRKTLGSSRKGLIAQFLVEAAMMCTVAAALCLLFLWLALPLFDELTGRRTDFVSFFIGDLWKYLVGFILFGTFLIGAYPAIQLSAFRPVEVLKGIFVPGSSGTIFREVFVGFQALVSFSLVASILVIVDQVRFVSSQSLGIDVNQVLAVRTPQTFDNLDKYLSSLNSFKSEMTKDNRVVRAASSADTPGESVNWIGGVRRFGAPAAESVSVFRSVIDKDFIPTLAMRIVSGKNFSVERTESEVMINQSAARALGFTTDDEAIGQLVSFGTEYDSEVIGVVEDFHQITPRDAIVPTVFHCNVEAPRLVFIRFAGQDANEIVDMAHTSFTRLFPGEPFDYYFLDEFFDRQYSSERKLTAILGTFCGLAVLVSSLGLLGLTWFRLTRQKKELAIRKIIGSSDLGLFYKASGRVFLTTLIGCIVGIAVTWYVMTLWLQEFTLHTQPKVWEFAIALASSMLIALLTVSGYTLRVIRSNPVMHLRQD